MTDLVKKEECFLPADLAGLKDTSWGAGADLKENKELFKNDFLIPKLMLCQAMSQAFKDRAVDEGEFYNSINQKVLSDGDEPLHFVVVNSFKRWQAFKQLPGGAEEYSKEDSGIMTLQNANWEYEYKKDGNDYRRRQVLSFTILLASDLDQGLKRPYILDCKGASKMAGRVIVTDVNEISDAGYPSAVIAFALTSKDEKNERGAFKVMKAVKSGHTNKEVVALAKEVYANLKKHEDQIEIDDRDLVKGEI